MADEATNRKLTEMHVVSIQEHWATILLENGDLIRLKPIILTVHRVEGATTPAGIPVYFVRTENVTDVRHNSKETT